MGTGLCWSWVWRPVVMREQPQEAEWQLYGNHRSLGCQLSPALCPGEEASITTSQAPSCSFQPDLPLLYEISGTRRARHCWEGLCKYI